MKLTFIKNPEAWSGIIVAALLFIAIITCYFVFTQHSQSPLPSGMENNTTAELNSTNNKSSDTIPEVPEELSEEDRLVKKLKEMYEKTISEKSTQVLLLKTKQYLLKRYPKDGHIRFYAILKRAFPEFADEIMKTIKAMELYLLWEKENAGLLSQMNSLEKKGALWDKREELFGDDAATIWSEERDRYEKRKQDMQETISRLDQSYDSTIYEKLDDYQNSLNNVYKNTSEAYILQSTDLLSKVFLSLDSVQSELKQMTPEDRRLELQTIRSEMGYTQAQIEKLEEIDEYKNKRWDNGLAYMNERDSLLNDLEGPEQDKALADLREKYFKHEAKTIEAEENDGFFRYTRRRIYGKN